MDASSELIKGLQFLMAGEADIGLCSRVFLFEGNDPALSFRFCVLLSGAVAGFTLLSPVGVLLESLVELAVAPLANFGANISFLLDLSLVLAEAREADHGYQQHDCEHQDHQIPNSDHNGSPRFSESGILNLPSSAKRTLIRSLCRQKPGLFKQKNNWLSREILPVCPASSAEHTIQRRVIDDPSGYEP